MTATAPIRNLVFALTVLLGYVAYVLPTTMLHLAGVIIASIAVAVLHAATYNERSERLVAIFLALAIGGLLAFALTGPPPA